MFPNKRLKIDLNSMNIETEEIPEPTLKRFLGGRGLNVKLLYKLTDSKTRPFAEENPLIFGTGPVSGTMFPSSGRYNVTSISPLTGILGDSNSHGFWGAELALTGHMQIVVTGKAEKPIYLFLKDDEIEIKDASNLWGKTTWKSEQHIKKKLKDNRIQVASIGPAGENLVKIAGVINNLSRAAARTGLGAIMGSKKLKAIAVRGTKEINISNVETFLSSYNDLIKQLESSPNFQSRSQYGTAMILDIYQEQGTLPTRYFKSGKFDKSNKINHVSLYQNYVKKRKGCFACPIDCSKYSEVRENSEKIILAGEGPEFETICAFGSQCGNDDLETVLRMNNLANKLGLDTISAGDMIAFAIECYQRGYISEEDAGGLQLDWGEKEAITELLRKIAYREDVGDVLAEGVKVAAEKIADSKDLAIHVKGLEAPEQEVRGLKGWGLGWIVSTRGADHLRGYPAAESDVDPLAYEGKAKLIKNCQDISAVTDSLEVCKFMMMALSPSIDTINDLVNSITEWNIESQDLIECGERIYNLERMFNARRGITREDDRPPKRQKEVPLPGGPAKGEILNSDRMLDEYYEHRGWKSSDGLPGEEKLEELGLLNIIEKNEWD